MKKFLSVNKYRIIGAIILIIVVIAYQKTDQIIVAKDKLEKLTEVYSRDVTEIPVLKSRLKLDADATESAQVSDSLTNNIEDLTSKAIYIEDIDTATKLYEKNDQLMLLPASTTKLMTAMVARDVFDLDEVLTVTDVATVEGYSVGLFAGEQILVRDLLKAALIQSSNDAAYVLAMNHQGGVEGFVELMNQKADELLLENTYFENPAGFDSENHHSSAHDLAIISKELMKDEFLKQIVGVKEEVISDSTGVYKHYLYNTHELLGADESVVGIKTGTTEGAGEVLVTQFNREGRNILIVLMESQDRYTETSWLIDWVFDNYVWLTPEQIVEKS